LDHEEHDMSEQRETVSTDMDQAIPRLAEDRAPFDDAQGRLRQGGRTLIFFTNFWLFEPKVREKDKSSTMLPQANPASIWLTAWFARAPRTSCD
jgi:hypothetical protein